MKRGFLLFSVLFFFAIGSLWGQQADFFVNGESGDDANDGASWSTAFATLSKALEITNAKGTEYNGTIYIARGTYYPTSHGKS